MKFEMTVTEQDVAIAIESGDISLIKVLALLADGGGRSVTKYSIVKKEIAKLPPNSATELQHFVKNLAESIREINSFGK